MSRNYFKALKSGIKNVFNLHREGDPTYLELLSNLVLLKNTENIDVKMQNHSLVYSILVIMFSTYIEISETLQMESQWFTIVTLAMLGICIATLVPYIKAQEKQRSATFDLFMITAQIKYILYCFDFAGRKFTLSDHDIERYYFGVFVMLSCHQVMIAITVKKLRIQLISYVFMAVGLVFGYLH